MFRPSRVLGRLGSLIPPVSATELGAFRLVFGLGLAWVLYDMRLSDQAFPLELHMRVHRLAEWEWVHTLAARPALVAQLEWAMVAMAIVFSVGFFSRLTFVALVLAITMWTLVRLTHTGAHNWSALFVTLWAMLPVPWDAGLSVPALIRRLRGRAGTRERRARYGYALWVPGLVFGAAMAGAGTAKLVQSGLPWITNGSVKYHFVIDARHAPTDWGLWVASHHWVAVALSAAAILTECTLVFAVLIKDWRWRLPFAFGALGLLVGFYVFQNELWQAWWLLCLAFFVPWPALVRTVSARAASTPDEAHTRVTAAQVAMILLVCALQIVASIERIEISPIMSNYPMYDSTFTSVADFDRRRPAEARYHFAVRFADGVEAPASEPCERLELDGPLIDAYRAISDGHRNAGGKAILVAEAAAQQLVEHFHEPIAAIIVLVDERSFDWSTGRFHWSAIRKPVYTFEIQGTSPPRS